MKKFKKITALALAAITAVSAMSISAMASASEITTSDSVDISDVGTSLMTTLLERQYESFVDSSICDTSDIMVDSESNNFYNCFLKWYSSSSETLGEAWTEYEYDLSLEETNGNTLKFSNAVRYWVEDCGFEWANSDIFYEITIDEIDSQYYITDIKTNAGDYNDFKRLIDEKIKEQKISKSIGTSIMAKYVNELIDESQDLSAVIESMNVDKKDIVDMEQTYQEYLSTVNAVMPLSTAYSYNGERGRNYADTYATSRNTCFYEATGNDCTNFVSQCIWAAYGGWTPGDSTSTMTTNISNLKRMQSSSSSANWFGGSGGGGTPWETVTGLWNFLNTTNSTGPRATKNNNNGKYSNIAPGDILTGQVLQMRYGSSGSYGHSVFVAGGVNDSYDNIKVAQHTDNRIRSLKNLINAWGGNSNCYMRQLKFKTAYFDR